MDPGERLLPSVEPVVSSPLSPSPSRSHSLCARAAPGEPLPLRGPTGAAACAAPWCGPVRAALARVVRFKFSLIHVLRHALRHDTIRFKFSLIHV
jgi:hypothetical protein